MYWKTGVLDEGTKDRRKGGEVKNLACTMLQCSAWQQNLPSSMDLLRPGDMVKTDTGRGRGAAVQKKNSQGWCVRHIFPAELACTHGANICIVYTHQPYHHIAAGVNYSNEVAWPMTPTTGQLSSLPCQFSFDRC